MNNSGAIETRSFPSCNQTRWLNTVFAPRPDPKMARHFASLQNYKSTTQRHAQPVFYREQTQVSNGSHHLTTCLRRQVTTSNPRHYYV